MQVQSLLHEVQVPIMKYFSADVRVLVIIVWYEINHIRLILHMILSLVLQNIDNRKC